MQKYLQLVFASLFLGAKAAEQACSDGSVTFDTSNSQLVDDGKNSWWMQDVGNVASTNVSIQITCDCLSKPPEKDDKGLVFRPKIGSNCTANFQLFSGSMLGPTPFKTTLPLSFSDIDDVESIESKAASLMIGKGGAWEKGEDLYHADGVLDHFTGTHNARFEPESLVMFVFKDTSKASVTMLASPVEDGQRLFEFTMDYAIKLPPCASCATLTCPGGWHDRALKAEFDCLSTSCSSEDVPVCCDANTYAIYEHVWYTQFISLGITLVELWFFIGAVLGIVIIAVPLAIWLDRRLTILVGCLFMILGAIGMCVWHGFWFETARFVIGLGVGIMTFVLPLFLAEIAPAAIRGGLVIAFSLLMVICMVVAVLVASTSDTGNLVPVLVLLLPAALIASGIFCLPSSPRHDLVRALRRGHDLQGAGEAAQASLARLRKIWGKYANEFDDVEMSPKEKTISCCALFTDSSIRCRLVTAISLQWMQQFTGITALLSFGPAILDLAPLPMSAMLPQIIIGCCILVGVIGAVLGVDRFGRRPLLLGGAVCMFACMLNVTVIAYIVQSSSKSTVALNCWLFACMCGFFLAFGFGWGGVCWLYTSEIFPMDIKELGIAITVCMQWTANFVMGCVVPVMVKHMTLGGTFLFFTMFLLAIIFLVYTFIPETKGMTLEQMHMHFGQRMAVDNGSSSDDSDSSVEEGAIMFVGGPQQHPHKPRAGSARNVPNESGSSTCDFLFSCLKGANHDHGAVELSSTSHMAVLAVDVHGVWYFADAAHPTFATPVPDGTTAIIRGDTALVEGPDSWSYAERVTELQSWRAEKIRMVGHQLKPNV